MAADTKERILDAALALFAQNGYPGTSMRDIASTLGITKAALYKHYTGKQEILDSIVERMNQMIAHRSSITVPRVCCFMGTTPSSFFAHLRHNYTNGGAKKQDRPRKTVRQL